jgi:methylmalonyl-CoA mutase C-terminal domain/subunit
VRRRADLEVGGPIEDVRDAQRQRFLTWWFSEDRTRLGLEGELPAAEGSVVARAIERLAEKIPVMPGEENRVFSTARNADALVALCSARIAEDQDADRATVVVHVRAGDGSAGSDIDGGPVIHPDTARRLLCEARTQVVVEDDAARPLALGRMTREPSAWMLRQLRYRDGGCTFPGCGSQRFAKAHHVRVVAPRRDDRPRQPHHGLQLPPQARPRARMEGRARRGRDDALVPAGRNAILGRSVGAGYCRTAPRGGSLQRRPDATSDLSQGNPTARLPGVAGKIRIVIAKPGLDGHDRGAKVVARALRDAGFEVIYTGLHQTPEQIVEAAIQEDADAIGLSCHSGAHMTLFPKVVRLLKERDAGDIVVFGGGIIPADDIPELERDGIEKIFTPGAPTGDIIAWLRARMASAERAG